MNKSALFLVSFLLICLITPHLSFADSKDFAPEEPEDWPKIFNATKIALEKTKSVRNEKEVRSALILGVLWKETGYGKNFGRTEGKWKEFCDSFKDYKSCREKYSKNYCDECKNWINKDCHSDYSNVVKVIKKDNKEEKINCFEKIYNDLEFDIKTIPTSSTCALGFTQFEPVTWWDMKERHKGDALSNPWVYQDSILASAYKLKEDGAPEDEKKALSKYYGTDDTDYINPILETAQIWEDNFLKPAIEAFCKSSSDFSCALEKLKGIAEDCCKDKKNCNLYKIKEKLNQQISEKEKSSNLSDLNLPQIPIENAQSTTPVLPQSVQPKPVLTSPLEITPKKAQYQVGDSLTAKFAITNKGNVSITFDKLTVGGRLNGGCPDNKCPDFTHQKTTLQSNQSYQYEGTLKLEKTGNYHFFIAYYIQNPTPEEKKLLDENNWNTSIGLGEGLTDKDRVKDIVIANSDNNSQNSLEEIPKTAKPDVNLFVMSHCPFGNQAEDAMAPVIDLLKNKFNVTLNYITSKSGNSYKSLQGVNELNEDIREMCVQKYEKDKFWSFIKEMNAETTVNDSAEKWEGIAQGLGIDVNKIKTCAANEASTLLDADIELMKKYSVNGSPTLIINGTVFSGSRTSNSYKDGICLAFQTVPEECNTQ